MMSNPSCTAWLVVDGDGQVVAGEKETTPLQIASITKTMTALLVLKEVANDSLLLKQRLVVSREASLVTGTTAKLRVGESYSILDLLYGLMLPSGNDAAFVLAEHFGRASLSAGDANPSEISVYDAVMEFVRLMNVAAHDLQMNDTLFGNPHGLFTPIAQSTAVDVAIMVVAAMQNPLFRRIVNAKSYTARVTKARRTSPRTRSRLSSRGSVCSSYSSQTASTVSTARSYRSTDLRSPLPYEGGGKDDAVSALSAKSSFTSASSSFSIPDAVPRTPTSRPSTCPSDDEVVLPSIRTRPNSIHSIEAPSSRSSASLSSFGPDTKFPTASASPSPTSREVRERLFASRPSSKNIREEARASVYECEVETFEAAIRAETPTAGSFPQRRSQLLASHTEKPRPAHAWATSLSVSTALPSPSSSSSKPGTPTGGIAFSTRSPRVAALAASPVRALEHRGAPQDSPSCGTAPVSEEEEEEAAVALTAHPRDLKPKAPRRPRRKRSPRTRRVRKGRTLKKIGGNGGNQRRSVPPRRKRHQKGHHHGHKAAPRPHIAPPTPSTLVSPKLTSHCSMKEPLSLDTIDEMWQTPSFLKRLREAIRPRATGPRGDWDVKTRKYPYMNRWSNTNSLLGSTLEIAQECLSTTYIVDGIKTVCLFKGMELWEFYAFPQFSFLCCLACV